MPDDVDTPRLAVIGVVGVVLVMLMVLVAEIVYFKMSRDLERERNVLSPIRELSEYKAEQLERLNRYSVVDAKRGKVTIPIERAMTITLEDLTRAHQNRAHSDRVR